MSAAELIATEQHRHTGGEQKRRHEVADLTLAKSKDPRIVGRSLCAVVVGAVVLRAVGIALIICFVVLVVVRDEVGECEAVMCGDEVDGCHRTTPTVMEQVGRSGQAGAEFTDTCGAAPEVAQAASISVIPLAPRRWVVTHLIPAVAKVPRFGDELHPPKHRILLKRGHECSGEIDTLGRAGKSGRQVESKTVHVHVGDPIAQ